MKKVDAKNIKVAGTEPTRDEAVETKAQQEPVTEVKTTTRKASR